MKLAALIISALLSVAPATAEPARSDRGLAGIVEVTYPSPLRARTNQSPLSPVTVRVLPLIDGRGQRIEFVGSVAGNFDLRDFVERQDGRSISDLAPIPVTIVSTLPPGHGPDLFGGEQSWLSWRAHYRELMWLAVIAWLAVPVVAIGIRIARRRDDVVQAPELLPARTLDDELLAALDAAAGAASPEQHGQLELLMFRYLGARLGRPMVPTDDAAATLRRLREDPGSRPLVEAVERWLHARSGGENARSHARSILEEFRRTTLAATTSAPAAEGST